MSAELEPMVTIPQEIWDDPLALARNAFVAAAGLAHFVAAKAFEEGDREEALSLIDQYAAGLKIYVTPKEADEAGEVQPAGTTAD